MLSQSIFREFEDLKNKMAEKRPKSELLKILDNILSRSAEFANFRIIRKTNEFLAEVQLLKKYIEQDKPATGLSLNLQNRVRKLRDRTLAADKKEEIVKEFAFA